MAPLVGHAAPAAVPSTPARSVTSLSGPGWKLWRDTAAKWADDVLFTPPVDLAAVPVNPPTGDWEQLETWPFRLGTSVAVVPCGKGKVVVSTLDICDHLLDPDTTAEVSRKLFCNVLEFANP